MISVKRNELLSTWGPYAKRREEVAAENWGAANEQRLFLGSNTANGQFFNSKFENSCNAVVNLSPSAAYTNQQCDINNDGNKR